MMHESNIQAVSLWGWLGWFLFALAMLMFYRVWSSDPHTAMRRMREELEKARGTIAMLEEIEGRLKARNEELDLELAEVQDTNRKLAGRVQDLEAVNRAQSDVIDRMERSQKEMLGRIGHHDLTIDRLKEYVVKLEAERGRLADFQDLK